MVGGLLAGHLSGYTTLTAMRGGLGYTGSLLRVVIGVAAPPAMLAIYVWGFINRPWWVLVALFLGLGLIVVPVLYGRDGRLMFLLHFQFQPLYDLLCIATAVALWLGVGR